MRQAIFTKQTLEHPMLQRIIEYLLPNIKIFAKRRERSKDGIGLNMRTIHSFRANETSCCKSEGKSSHLFTPWRTRYVSYFTFQSLKCWTQQTNFPSILSQVRKLRKIVTLLLILIFHGYLVLYVQYGENQSLRTVRTFSHKNLYDSRKKTKTVLFNPNLRISVDGQTNFFKLTLQNPIPPKQRWWSKPANNHKLKTTTTTK